MIRVPKSGSSWENEWVYHFAYDPDCGLNFYDRTITRNDTASETILAPAAVHYPEQGQDTHQWAVNDRQQTMDNSSLSSAVPTFAQHLAKFEVKREAPRAARDQTAEASSVAQSVTPQQPHQFSQLGVGLQASGGAEGAPAMFRGPSLCGGSVGPQVPPHSSADRATSTPLAQAPTRHSHSPNKLAKQPSPAHDFMGC